MAQGRPVSALEIKREVEGYSDMNDDAFARRFYADRAELESLGIQLGVEKPGEGFFEAELYSLPPENFYLDAINFADDELAALTTALLLLTDGGFAYAEPLRLALQQVAWGHPNPLTEARARPGRDGDDRLRRRPRPLPAPVEDRDRDLAPQDDRVHLLHDGARRDREAQGRPLPPGLPRRPVLLDRPLARARGGARLPPLPDPGQGRLRLQGRARLLAAGGLRPPRLRQPRRLAAGGDPGHGEDLDPRADRLADRARLRHLRRAARRQEVRRRPGQGHDLRNRLRLGPRADRLGPALARERRGARARRPARGDRGPPGAAARPPRQRLRARPRSSTGRCARRPAARAPTAAATRRSGPSASPASSPSPGC